MEIDVRQRSTPRPIANTNLIDPTSDQGNRPWSAITPRDRIVMEEKSKSRTSLREKIADEMLEFVVLASYLFICFAALAYLKATILSAQGVDYEPWAFAAIKAAVCAKFMLLGRAFNVGGKFAQLPLIVPTLRKSFAFLVLLVAFAIIEAIVVGLVHDREILESISEIGGGSRDQMIATTAILFLILIPYFAFRSLGEVIGEKTLVRLFFERRQSDESDH